MAHAGKPSVLRGERRTPERERAMCRRSSRSSSGSFSIRISLRVDPGARFLNVLAPFDSVEGGDRDECSRGLHMRASVACDGTNVSSKIVVALAGAARRSSAWVPTRRRGFDSLHPLRVERRLLRAS